MSASPKSPLSTFRAAIAEDIWARKYRPRSDDGGNVDATVADTFRRVADAAANAEGSKENAGAWAGRFYSAMSDFGFLPAGRILAGAGANRDVTMFNCFVMGPVPDDLGGIFDSVKDAALTLQSGGGIGVDFSTLRPRGALVASIGADASGPVSFMDVWDSMCRTIMSAGARRGAMMATLRADHPDIETFIDAKSAPGRLTNFNLSVLVPDRLIEAVEADDDWELVFEGKVHRKVRARDLWNRIMRATYDVAEPGVVFIDRVNVRNNLGYCETINATNPCGEQPLPPFGACLLGSINLAQFVRQPFEDDATLDIAAMTERVETAVRMLDNVIDISRYPLAQQEREAKAKRRIGLGLTGLADALVMCGLTYGSKTGRETAAEWMRAIQHSAYRASIGLAKERGAFALFDRDQFLAAPTVRALPDDIRHGIAQHGIRNGCLTSIAPTGTISLLAGNVSSGIEPIFDLRYHRKVLDDQGGSREEMVEDFAYAQFRKLKGPDAVLPDTFVTAALLSPADHLSMQAALQPFVDSAISKTINCPRSTSFEEFKSIYRDAYAQGLKGCTTYRPNEVRGAVLTAADAEPDGEEVLKAKVQGAQRIGPTAGRPEQTSEPDVVYLSEPLEREAALGGFTYKIKWPGSDHAIYVTLNDIEQDGRRRPFEIFINTKNLEHYAWTVALTRMISAVFRRGGDVSFVAEELKAIFDPQGGRWVEGRYVPSLLAAIGGVIEDHMRRIGFMGEAGGESVRIPRAVSMEKRGGRRNDISESGAMTSQTTNSAPRACPQCGAAGYHREEGCWVCRSCGFSRCD